MKNRLSKTMAAATLALGVMSAAHGDTSAKGGIHDLLKTYQEKLNASDVGGVLALYTEDGVFMPQHSASAIGLAAIRTAYEHVFEAITLDIEFDIAEVKVIADDWAFARTYSTGTTTINATGDRVDEANQELFVLQKVEGGAWKIARYSFSTTIPR